MRIVPPLHPLVFLLALAGACARLPEVIVLEDPLTPAEHVALGVSYERAGELEPAAREYARALSSDRGNFRARLNLGNVRLAQKEYGKARKEYLRALALRPGDPEATNNLAWAAILSGKERADALQRMERVLSDPAHRTPGLLDTLGVLLARMARTTEARKAFDEAESACRPPACPEETLREIRAHRLLQ